MPPQERAADLGRIEVKRVGVLAGRACEGEGGSLVSPSRYDDLNDDLRDGGGHDVRCTTSLIAGSSNACGASSHATVALVTTCGRSRPAATRSRMAGIAGRAIARPMWRCTPRV